MTTLFNNTKGLALLYQVVEIYKKVYTSDSPLLGSNLGTILMVVHVALEDTIFLYLPPVSSLCILDRRLVSSG